MRKFALLLASILSLQAAELPRVSPESVGMSTAKLRQIDNRVLEQIVNNKLAGATVAVTRNGKIVHFRSYGHADIENDQPWDDDTILRIYSMTKAITSTAVMMLHEDGKFDLDDSVAKFLPEFKQVKVSTKGKLVKPIRPMTVRDLLRHTSGLTYGVFGNTDVDKAYRKAGLLNDDQPLSQMSAKLAKLPLVAHPGTQFNYSVSTDLLGRLVEVWSGQSFDQFLKQHIFKPLDMKDTGFFVPKKKRARLANVYFPGKDRMTLRESAATSNFLKRPKFSSGGGGLVSTTRDYLHFVQMIANGG
ncbi:MAG: serine hydrolase domain-containing protein, partial [Limisphaerales bacterium]